MIRNSLRAACLLLAAGVVSALGIAATDAMAAARASTVRHGPATDDPNPIVTPCGACYRTKEQRLYVSLDAIGSARAISLELDAPRDGQWTYRELLAPYRVENGYVVYLVPQGPIEDVGGGSIRWTSSNGKYLRMGVSVDTSGGAQ
ncbi:hypothetical protein WMF20_15775 [Sorangium sp. So ce834]|uniref:hypothetical protein n=1 Tax=Sorangium sp. So ce834 TaxID=3133321 RepID=UPI003F5FCB64